MGCVIVAVLLACAPVATAPAAWVAATAATLAPPTAGSAHVEAAASRDPWLGEDKIRHFSMSYAIVGFGDAAARAAGGADDAALVGAVLASAVAGVLKEVYDRAHGGFFSHRDLAWNLAGIAAGVALVRRAR